MHNIIVSEPMDLIHINLMGLEMTVYTKEKPDMKKVLVVVDYFFHYVQAIKVDNK